MHWLRTTDSFKQHSKQLCALIMCIYQHFTVTLNMGYHLNQWFSTSFASGSRFYIGHQLETQHNIIVEKKRKMPLKSNVKYITLHSCIWQTLLSKVSAAK